MIRLCLSRPRGSVRHPYWEFRYKDRANSITLSDVSYALVLLARLLGYFFGHDIAPVDGPYSFPLPISLGLHGLGFLFLFFAFITFNFPSDAPVTPNSMNYTSAAIGLIALLSIFTWLITARKQFKGPADVQDLVVDGVEQVGEAGEGSASCSEKGKPDT